MKTAAKVLLVAFMLLFLTAFTTWTFILYNEQSQSILDFSEVYASSKDSVVWLRVEYVVKGQGPFKPSGGSGVVLEVWERPDKKFEHRILTNYHVIEAGQKILVYLSFTERYEAGLVGFDDFRDLAVVRIVADRKLKPVVFGDSSALKIGESIYTIGSPYNLPRSLSMGYVSNFQPDSSWDHIQLNSGVNPGNSGGGLFNRRKELVGIVRLREGDALGFAVSSNLVKRILPRIFAEGRVMNGYFGMDLEYTYNISEEQAQKEEFLYPLPVNRAVVLSTAPKNPAANAGLKKGDVFLEIGGQETRGVDHVQKLVAESPVGKKVPVKILRNGQELTLEVIPEERPLFKAE